MPPPISAGAERIAGCDEAGRGPLAGPVVAAVVVLNPANPIDGLRDSKQLSPRQRDYLTGLIKERALAWSIAQASVEEIDAINILQAALLAMRRAVQGLPLIPDRLLVDGNHLPRDLLCPASAIIRGDQTIPCISAASILAKTYRDALMGELDALYPDYGFKRHKGYGTPQHLEALARWGATPVHRRSFSPVRWALRSMGRIAQ